MNQEDETKIRTNVREHYAAALEEKSGESSCGCCGSSKEPCCEDTTRLYEDKDIFELPDEITGTSFGCGDPVTLAALLPGQTVLDLGSGGGLDCFLAARKVGPSGHVIGVDMTPQMIDRARANTSKLGLGNVEFRLGEIEHLPVVESSVDVVISNCVINLSPDKAQVFREIFRVMKPGGKLAVSDIVTDGPLPQAVKDNLSAWAGCISGALDVNEYISAIEKAGFVKVKITPVFFDDGMLKEAEENLDKEALKGFDREKISKTIFSAKITAVKN